jgi:hypothetical protein
LLTQGKNNKTLHNFTLCLVTIIPLSKQELMIIMLPFRTNFVVRALLIKVHSGTHLAILADLISKIGTLLLIGTMSSIDLSTDHSTGRIRIAQSRIMIFPVPQHINALHRHILRNSFIRADRRSMPVGVVGTNRHRPVMASPSALLDSPPGSLAPAANQDKILLVALS